MPRKSTSKEKVDAYIARLSPPHKRLVESLRKIVVRVSPKLEEKYKWRMPCYFRKGLVCYISAGKRHVTFGFYRGARLKDPKGLLEGIGKELRHVKIRRKRDISSKVVLRLGQEGLWH
ncbi:MAG: DUF1801 domain-containing protein [Ignavibacteria bacterium]|nr:DUF1801 domain-containing protein [Ignavibacteria bacterium]